MKVALAAYGTRGDVEPCLAVGYELSRRGHEVLVAVPPDQIAFVESAGFTAVAYGPDSQMALAKNSGANQKGESAHRPWQLSRQRQMYREDWEFQKRCRSELAHALMSVTEGADLLFHGQVFEDLAGNVAEYYDIPMVTLHYYPLRPNGQLLQFLPAPLGRATMAAFWWITSRVAGNAEKEQRQELGLPKDSRSATRRISERGSLELQAYDDACFPGLAQEWANWRDQRPFVGALTLEVATQADDEVTSWIAAGTPPICFAFGSMSMRSPADTLAMISDACAQLGERALICAGSSGFNSADSHADHVKVVNRMNYAAIFPTCRAIVHHGGAGTAAGALRAGVPTLILWSAPDRQMWGSVIKRLKVGTSRRFSRTTAKSLVADLRQILTPQYADRARQVAAQMTKPAEGAAAAADLVETFANVRCR
ncbi:glycosyltransferase [Mycolicibacterium sphagni]|uniref:Glycosyl transferase family 1 n=1 Tax=Mycolicibacterium sphagni TaxID=1786 RepID=A0A255D8S9_9MYCO|nr:nucleotide disphospho-sugar-binding domain-containing protein [Mycolicibacterium sphagni]OYN75031.1 glycosyl transferase family 1 [Mycolicibacterium sphagni]